MADRCVHTDSLDGRPLAVYERTGLVPVGAVMIPTVLETYYVWEAPGWPKVRIRARRGLWWLLARFGRTPGLLLDDPRFNTAFRVDAEDEGIAILLLTPPMQAFLQEKPSVDWSAGRGAIKLFYRGRLRRDRMPASLERLRRFWSLIPDELRAWDG